MSDSTIPGYRPRGDRPRERQLSMGYLQQSAESARLLQELWDTPGKNCEGREEQFSGDELPSDREAAIMCSGCPALQLCEQYRQTAHPAYGVWAGRVQGRALDELIREDNEWM